MKKTDFNNLRYWLEDLRVTSDLSIGFNCKNMLKKKRHDNASCKNIAEYESLQDKLNSCKSLKDLKSLVLEFDGCEIKKHAQNTVFADGSNKSGLMIIGEAPGEQEDIKGIPFCGQSGDLLENILLSIGIKRQDVYISNVVFWRPPNNRKPTSDEIFKCRPFLFRHIELFDPKAILLLGAVSLNAIFDSNYSVTYFRNQVLNSPLKHLLFETPNGRSVPVFVSYHPSYLMRRPIYKKIAWNDWRNLKEFLLSRPT